jgi:putative flippase GtrA
VSERLDHRSFRHWGGFLFSGGTAFIIDAALTTGLIRFASFNPFGARLIAILVAMVAAWLLHRRITFNVRSAPNRREFGRFAAVAWSANALNYVAYAAILLVRPATFAFLALLASTILATFFSYAGFRLGVFREPPPPS